MIEVHRLTKRYGPVLAVDDLSFRVEPGRVTGFLGPNGAGKSTTMRAMVGLDRPTSGRVLLDGRPYEQLTRPLRTVGTLLEATALHPGRTAHGHLLGLARSNRIPEHRVPEVLDMVGLGGVAHRRTKGFSLGMAQRLGIAAALLGDPRILLLDEPVNGLDPAGIRWIRELMRDLARDGRAVLVSSHLIGELAQAADHVVVIGRGRLLADSSVPELVARHARPSVVVRTPEPERLCAVLAAEGIAAHRGADGAVEATGATVAGVDAVAARGDVPVYEVGRRAASLEEAFLRLTADHADHRATAGAR